MNAFIDAFNRGDDPARFFAPAGPLSERTYGTVFRWYSASGGPPNVAIYERSKLAAYFAERQLAGERWSQVRLVSIIQEYPRAGFGIFVTRTAPDIAPRGPVEGKGSVNCAERTILMLTM